MRKRQFDPRQFRSAVVVVARQRARNVVKAQIRATGQKIWDFTAAQISELASDYVAQHPELVAKAIEDAWSFPEFARWRDQQCNLNATYSANRSEIN